MIPRYDIDADGVDYPSPNGSWVSVDDLIPIIEGLKHGETCVHSIAQLCELLPPPPTLADLAEEMLEDMVSDKHSDYDTARYKWDESTYPIIGKLRKAIEEARNEISTD
jgi:hypothetical protein